MIAIFENVSPVASYSPKYIENIDEINQYPNAFRKWIKSKSFE